MVKKRTESGLKRPDPVGQIVTRLLVSEDPMEDMYYIPSGQFHNTKSETYAP